MWKWLVFFLCVCAPVFAAGRTIIIPENVTDDEAKEWMAVLQERKTNQAVEQNAIVKAEIEKAKTSIDAYRKAVGLSPKFEAPKEVEPIQKPKEGIKAE